jgi:DNA helicase II / ATP-dependent DNA helicase PcrA
MVALRGRHLPVSGIRTFVAPFVVGIACVVGLRAPPCVAGRYRRILLAIRCGIRGMIDQRACLNLTDQQQQIVAHTYGPALVYAVAGAGKTTAMVHRVARLVREQVFAPEQILVSSFNRAAVDDIGRALEPWPACRPVARQTLHALGYTIVRNAAEVGVLPRFARDAVRADGGERQLFFAAREYARRQRLLAPAELDALDEQAVLNYIGGCKGNLQYADLRAAGLPEAALRTARQADPPPDQPHLLSFYKLYERVRNERGWLTFDDMLLLAWEAFQRSARLLDSWQRRYAAVLVDEFQDVNLAQAEMLDLLTGNHRNYMAIGDDDQTIYSFRGARRDYFRTFEQRYGATVYTMTDNFRCQGAQVLLANQVIAQNAERHPKTLVVTQGFGGTTALQKAPDAPTMARRIVSEVQLFQAQGYRLAEIALLVRLTAQTPPIEQALAQAGIAYQVAGDEPFYRRREIVELLMYLELAAFDAALRAGRRLSRNEAERLETCWRRVAHRPTRYLTRQSSDAVLGAALRHRQPLSASLSALAAGQNDRRAELVQSFAALLIWLGDAPAEAPAAMVLTRLEQLLDYQAFLRAGSGGSEAGEGAAQNVRAFLHYAEGKGTLNELRAHLEVLAQQEFAVAQPDRDAVDIRTIHRAKGLEWPVVLIPHCNNGYLPAQHADDWEEECRLLYVAITRAQRHLRLYALEGGKHQPSPFLEEAQAEAVLQQAEAIDAVLATDPERWTAAQALSLTTCPRESGQARFFTHWWTQTDATWRRSARRVLEFIAAVARRGVLERLGIQDADEAFWAELAGSPAPRHGAAFPGLEQLCAAPAPARAAAAGSERTRAAYMVGDRVDHTAFGAGVVVAIEAHGAGRSAEWYVTVQFPQRGRVKLLSSIAPLRRLG